MFISELHIHTKIGGDELAPEEAVKLLEFVGYKHIAITEHADGENISRIIDEVLKFCEGCDVIPGIEITRVKPGKIPKLVELARRSGIKLVLVHGESLLIGDTPEGTNMAAVESDVDILAHPGLVSREVVKKASKNGIALEISCRSAYAHTNGHIARFAMEEGASLAVMMDLHKQRHLVTPKMKEKIAIGAGITELQTLFDFERKLLEKLRGIRIKG